MFLVIFKATPRNFDAEYHKTADRLRHLAKTEYGCLDFVSYSKGDEEVTLSYWSDESSLRRWRSDPEHLAAQKKGKEDWYERYSTEVLEMLRRYDFQNEK